MDVRERDAMAAGKSYTQRSAITASAAGSGLVLDSLPDAAEGAQAGAQPGQLGGGDQRSPLGVDGQHRGAHGGRGRAAPIGRLDPHASSVLWVGVSFQVAARDQRVDQLAGGLLADAQFPDQV
jgi:hypothetical protein